MKALCIFIIWLKLAAACTLYQAPELVERSKRVVPRWVEQPAMQALEHDGALRLLMVRRDLADLPLGIKQTQLQAIHQLKSQLIEQTVEPIREQLRGGEPEDQEKIEKAFDEKVNALTYHKIFDQIEVEDLYFETKTGRQSIPGDVARVHNVYVLARFPLDHLADLRESFVSLLKDADKTELKELGASLSE